MLDLGTLRVGIEADSNKAVRALQDFKTNVQGAEDATKKSSQEIEEATSRINDAFGKITGTALAVGTAIAGAFAMTAQAALDGYASYEQNTGGIEKLFGTAGMSIEEYANYVGKSVDEVGDEYSKLNMSSDKVMQNASNAWKTAGLSANEYMEQTVKFGASLIKSLGGDTSAAADYADMAIRDMSDNVNTFGTDIETVQQAYQGFARGNFEALEQLALGYSGSKEGMENLIADANALKEANGEMADLSIDSFADIVEAIHLVQEAHHLAGTTAREASTTIEGSINSAKAAWQNWVTGLGDESANMQELTGNLVEAIVTAASNIIPRLQIIAGQILATVPVLFEELKASLPSEIQAVIDVVMAMLPAITGVVTAIMGVFAGLQLVNKVKNVIETVQALWTVLKANPVIAVIALIAGLATALVTAYNTNEDFKNFVDTAWAEISSTLGPIIQDIVTAVTDFASEMATNLAPAVQNGAEMLSNLASAIIEGVGQAMTDIGPFIDTCVTNFINFATDVANAVAPMITALVTAFTNFVNNIGPVVADFCTAAQSAFETAMPIIQSVTETVFGAIQSFMDTTMSIIQGIIEVVLGIIQGDWDTVFSALQSVAETIWGAIQSVIGTAMDIIQTGIDTALATLGSLWDSAWNGISTFLSDTWENIKTGVSDGISSVIDFFTNLPGQIIGALGDVGSLLLSAGQNIMQGLLDGIAGAVGGVIDFVSGIGAQIAAHKGPEAYDLKLLVPNGGWIMQSLATGLKKGMPLVYDALSDITDSISDFDYGTASVDASFNAYKRLKVLDGGKGANANGNSTNITVNNYSPKALTERESARQFRQSVRDLALAS